MLNDYFIKQSIREVELEDYIKVNFPAGDYSDILIQRTPLGLKIIIYTNKPGRIIGKGGKNIEKIGDSLKEKFGLENPQIDIKSVRHPDLDPKIVAKQIASALERGYNYKKIGNVFLKRILVVLKIIYQNLNLRILVIILHWFQKIDFMNQHHIFLLQLKIKI